MHQPVDTLEYAARAGKREISPLARRAALRALNRALALPRRRLLLYINEGFTSGFPGFHNRRDLDAPNVTRHLHKNVIGGNMKESTHQEAICLLQM